jgi:hypothetical protein
MICSRCQLEKAIKKVGRGYETYYFHSDENGNIKEFGLSCTRVPYGCGERSKYHLEEELFEI